MLQRPCISATSCHKECGILRMLINGWFTLEFQLRSFPGVDPSDHPIRQELW